MELLAAEPDAVVVSRLSLVCWIDVVGEEHEGCSFWLFLASSSFTDWLTFVLLKFFV